MSDLEVARDIYLFSVYTVRAQSDIELAIEKGFIEFTENVEWVGVAGLLDEVNGQEQDLPVILADSTSKPRSIMAWGIARKISVNGTRIQVRLEEVHEVPSRPLVERSLFSHSTNENISESDQRNHHIVYTPPFLEYEPATFILTWNPEKEVPLEDFEEIRKHLLDGATQTWNWTCRAVNKVKAGDRFLMLRQGDEPRGIVGSGWIRSDAWKTDDGSPYVDILWKYIVDLEKPLDPRSIVGADSFEGKKVHWKPTGSGIELRPEPVCEIVWQAWSERLIADGLLVEVSPMDSNLSDEESVRASFDSTESREDTASSIEGGLIPSWSTRRERDPNNRAQCLELYAPVCAVCDMNFLKEYGEIGRDFIHVHHERPLASSDADQGTVHVPARDMKPVCPNCHAMLHRGMNANQGEVRSIAELRAIREQAKNAGKGS